ncbi:HEAT repeat domain-containing protein [Nocardia asteroides]|uniref:HEAT repeat domain-containing protein n=1 Tax=Nocardia asteroides TaxID=1824 RepID=UPI001E35F698|nr:HEAT repeat domain-containing protein [Nocardia asteroides]UGT63167.1 HEAT repeat domain-containing protein [Nocardia asteroides]
MTPYPAREELNSPDWAVRRDAAQALGALLPATDALVALTALLNDDNIAVQQEAAEALARFGGRAGLAAVLEELGRRAEDGDADYIAYRLRELQIFEELPVLGTVRGMLATLTADGRSGLEQLEQLFGAEFPA